MILLSSAITFIQQQYNPNRHLIEISLLQDENSFNTVYSLTFDDELNIKNIIDKNNFSDVFVYSAYQINFGVSDNDGNTFFIRGISNEALNKFNFPELSYGQAFISNESNLENTVLNIPVIEIQDGGGTSSGVVPMDIEFIKLNKNSLPLNHLNDFDDTIYLNEETFKKVIEIAYKISWDEFYSGVNNK